MREKIEDLAREGGVRVLAVKIGILRYIQRGVKS